MTSKTDPPPDVDRELMLIALDLARQSPPRSSNFSVGALLVDGESKAILTTGFTLELDGNTHAEQCCLSKLATRHGIAEEQLSTVLPPSTALYTTIEPCYRRLSGNLSCVQRILQTRRNGRGISAVYVGVKEPEKFVGENNGRAELEAAGIKVILLPGLEEEILAIAFAGHTTSKPHENGIDE